MCQSFAPIKAKPPHPAAEPAENNVPCFREKTGGDRRPQNRVDGDARPKARRDSRGCSEPRLRSPSNEFAVLLYAHRSPSGL